MSLTVQFQTILAMIGMGAYLGVALDTYHRFFKSRRQKPFRAFVCDLLFWISHGVVFFLVLLAVNEGELRIYLFLAIFCGFATYQSVFRLLYLKILEILVQIFASLVNFLYTSMKRLFLLPIYTLVQIILFCVGQVWKVIGFVGIILLKVIWKCLPKKWREFLLKFWRGKFTK